MSLYAAGSHYRDGAALIELHYEEDSYQYFTLGETPDGYEGCRDAFLGGGWRTEKNPLGVECGKLTGSEELGGNPVGALMKRLTLRPGERRRLLFFLGQGDARAAGARASATARRRWTTRARRCMATGSRSSGRCR